MPRMGGIDAARNLREMGYKNKLVALTANATVLDKEHCFEVGMDDFLTKPLRLSRLRTAVHSSSDSET